MKKIIFLSLLLSLAAQAQDCGDIKDGAIDRLDSPGKSLHDAKVQDQDGLGTCYANTASLMLQSILPNNPEVSYLHLSINRAEKLVNKELKEQGKKQAFRDDGSLLLNAGFSCQAVNLAMESGGVCARKDVALEQMLFNSDLKQYEDSNWVQLDLLKKVSQYYDGMLRDFSDGPKSKIVNLKTSNEKSANALPETSSYGYYRDAFGIRDIDDLDKEGKNQISFNLNKSKFEQYKDVLKHVIDNYRDKYAVKSCEKTDPANALTTVKDMMFVLQNKITAKKEGKFGPHNYKLLKLGLGYTYNYKRSGIDVTEATIDRGLEKAIKDQYFKQLTKTPAPENAFEALKTVMKSKIRDIKDELFDEVFSELDPKVKSGLDSDYKRYALKDYSECSGQGKIDYLKNDDGMIKDISGLECASSFLPHIKNLQQMIIGLDQYNFDNIDRINDFISNLPSLNYDQAMMKLLAPNCSEDKKIKMPKNMKCTTESFTYPGTKDDDAETTEKHLKQMRSKFLDYSKKSIGNNKAMGLSMCTGFYDPEEKQSVFFNKDSRCDGTKPHGYHAVTMIGHKCVKGKMKYLIQNSWGAWDSAAPKFEKDSHGKAWMDEDDLIKNTYLLDILEQK